MKDWIFLIWQGHVWGHIEDTFKPSNFFLFRHFYSFEHILTEEYLIFIHTINITKNQMILVMSCFVVLKRRNWFELRIYSGSDWAQCEEVSLASDAYSKTSAAARRLKKGLMRAIRIRMEEPFESYLTKKNVGVGEWSLEAVVDHNDEWNMESAWFHHLRGTRRLGPSSPHSTAKNKNTQL